MTEKNIFAYKPFLSLNISDSNLFFMWQLQLPLKKVAPLFPSNLPLKVQVLSSPPFWKFGLRLNTPPPLQKGGGGGGARYISLIKAFSHAIFYFFTW